MTNKSDMENILALVRAQLEQLGCELLSSRTGSRCYDIIRSSDRCIIWTQATLDQIASVNGWDLKDRAVEAANFVLRGTSGAAYSPRHKRFLVQRHS